MRPRGYYAKRRYLGTTARRGHSGARARRCGQFPPRSQREGRVFAAAAAAIVVVTVRETTHSGESRETPWCALLAPRWLTRGAEGTVQRRQKNGEGRAMKEGGCDADVVSLLPFTSRSGPSSHHPTRSLTHAPTPSPHPNSQSRNKETQARVVARFSLFARPLNKEERQRPAVFCFSFPFCGKRKTHLHTGVREGKINTRKQSSERERG